METLLGLLGAFALGLVANECSALSPWLARKVVCWAASRWSSDPEISAAYQEEWVAIVDERPGKLFKLLTAFTFAASAIGRVSWRRASAVHAAYASLPEDVRDRCQRAAFAVPTMAAAAAVAGATSGDSGVLKGVAIGVGISGLVAVVGRVIWDVRKALQKPKISE